MNLKNFEKSVDPKICDRGLDYYENDQVFEIEQVEKGEFCATVSGSEDYTVFIKLAENLDIAENSCDCPYDWGNVCKHEVAVLYYIKDNELYKKALEEGIFHKIKLDLAQLDKQELVDMLLNLSKRNKSIKQEVLWELGYE